MLCQNCSKREATTHIKRVVNGEATEHHLCRQCASALGYDNFFEPLSLNLPDFFSGLFSDSSRALAASHSQRCEKCGSTFEDIIKTGMVGCADCYERFKDKLMPSIRRIHGTVTHTGSAPERAAKAEPAEKVKKAEKPQDELEQLEAQMKKAVDEQNFELAAVIRDKIKALKEGK